MCNIRRSAVIALLSLAIYSNTGKAQFPGGPPGPGFPAGPAGFGGGYGGNYGQGRSSFSPYLNLTRTGVSPAVSYYGIVRPQMQFSNSIQALQRQNQQVGPFTGTDPTADTPVFTGNAFGFQNQTMFFQNQYWAGGLGTGIGRSGYGMGSGMGGRMNSGGGMGAGAGGTGANGPSQPRTR